VPQTGRVEPTDRAERRRRGAWYTPDGIVAEMCAQAGVGPGDRVLDPACGDGRFLVEARHRGAAVDGVERDPDAAAGAAQAGTRVRCADALAIDWPEAPYDVVLGNPPFLNQLAATTTRGGRSRHGGGPYADAAVEFLALAHRLARPAGGRVALVLPASVLASRDAAPVRDAVLADGAVRHLWWLGRAFDAAVHTVVVVLVRGARPGPVTRAVGVPAVAATPAAHPRPGATWASLVTDLLGVPPDPPVDGPVLGGRAELTADFRDQYYGLAGAVSDTGDGPPLVTAGLLDPGRCAWGERPTRFRRQPFAAPRVRLDALAAPLTAWAARRLVPKVLVATQTRVLEAAPDPDGAWLPSVPVISVVPNDPAAVWALAAVLTSPVASAWVANRCAGTGLAPTALRPTARLLGGLPLPTRPWDDAVAALRAGDLVGCGTAVDAAYGAPDEARLAWWRAGLSPRPRR
jgi:SAM-dependent methyltransferase